MTDLQELYQEVILDHNKRPRNFGALDGASHRAEGFNPLCGDKFTVTLVVDGDRVTDVCFEGNGCAISTASASVMTELVRGKSRTEIGELFDTFRELVTGEGLDDALERLGKLAVFAGVRQFPVRVKCATLAWHTLAAALQGEKEAVSTE